MKFTLLIRAEQEEEVRAIVHEEGEFTQALQNMVLQYNGADKLPVYREDESSLLRLADMECIFAQDGKTWVVDRNGTRYRLRYRLYELEEQLPAGFIRINKSALANLSRIQKLSASFNGAVNAVFQCGYQDYVSRRCLGEIKRSMGLK